MNYNAPWSQFVMAINMPQCIWVGRFILLPLDYLVMENDPANIIYMVERGFNPVTLNLNSLLKEGSMDIVYSSVWM